MNNEDKLFNLMSKMCADLKNGQGKMQQDIDNNHGEKLQALFDGYTRNSEKLNRIEKEVSKHDKISLRRVNASGAFFSKLTMIKI